MILKFWGRTAHLLWAFAWNFLGNWSTWNLYQESTSNGLLSALHQEQQPSQEILTLIFCSYGTACVICFFVLAFGVLISSILNILQNIFSLTLCWECENNVFLELFFHYIQRTFVKISLDNYYYIILGCLSTSLNFFFACLHQCGFIYSSQVLMFRL